MAVCAVVVTYHPDPGFPGRFSRIAAQADLAVIVDNASAPAARAMLEALQRPPAVVLLRNPENLGVASALNRGVQHAAGAGCDWALLLDQDSEVEGELTSGLLAALHDCADGAPVAVVGARFRDTSGQSIEALRRGGEGDAWVEVESVITSGSLLSLAAYRAVGPFRDDFFIDYVDSEFCARARAAGFRIIQTRRPLMAHTVGAPTAHRFLGRTKWTTNHPPDRRYYIARNGTVMLRLYGAARGGGWRLKSLSRCLRLMKRIVLYENDKLAKLGAVLQGWRDALRGRMGRRR